MVRVGEFAEDPLCFVGDALGWVVWDASVPGVGLHGADLAGPVVDVLQQVVVNVLQVGEVEVARDGLSGQLGYACGGSDGFGFGQQSRIS